MAEPLLDDLDVSAPGKQPGRVSGAQAVRSDMHANVRLGDGPVPDLRAEPVVADAAVRVDHAKRARGVLADGSARGSVDGYTGAAVLATAPTRGVGGRG